MRIAWTQGRLPDVIAETNRSRVVSGKGCCFLQLISSEVGNDELLVLLNHRRLNNEMACA